jgi:endonuclease/exonuclease/phosphatase family metal-dependent hydrolase
MRKFPLAVVLGVVLLVDVLRAWLPSIITIFGQAAATPAEMLGAFALAWFLAAFAAPLLIRRAGAVPIAAGAALVLAGCRLALVGAAGHTQLYLSCVGLLAGLVWLSAVAWRGAGWGAVMGGLVAAASIHAALGTVDLTWRGGVLGWLAVTVTALAFLLLLPVTLPVARQEKSPDPGAFDTPGSIAWLLVGPAMFLGLQIGLSPALLGTGMSYLAGEAGTAVPPGPLGALATVLVFALSVALFVVGWWWAPRAAWWRWAGALGLPVGAALFGYGGGRMLPVAVPVVAGALGACLGAARRGPAVSATRRAYALVTGLLLFVVAVFAYYAAYDLGYPNGWVPVLVAIGVATPALRAGRAGKPADAGPADQRSLALAAAVTALALLASAAGVQWSPPAAGSAGGSAGLRVMAFNIRMGFGLDGRFGIDALARVISAERPAVVLLSEVDRGWLLNGGHDDMTILARRLGMRYVFAPAADTVWGDAILTTLPVASVRTESLPAWGAPTGAQVLGVVIRHPAGEVAVVSTHLQPPPDAQPTDQAARVAAFTTRFAGPVRPLVLGGDFNTQPGEAAFEAIIAGGLRDGLAARRPLSTSPADAPDSQIDHLFVRGAEVRDASAPRTTASDHLPVVATVTW